MSGALPLTVRVVGRPAPQGSHELGSAGQFRDSSDYLASWRAAVKRDVRMAFRDAGVPPAAMPLIGAGIPVHVHALSFILLDEQCRAAGTNEPTGRPDIDKLLRATLDGLTDARAYGDDAQVVKIHSLEKVRAQPGEQAGAFIIISDRPPVTSRESIAMDRTTEYEITLSRVTRDETGDKQYDSMLTLCGTAATIATAGVGAVAAIIGAGELSISLPDTDDEGPAPAVDERAPSPAAGEKRGRGRPRKVVAPPVSTAEPAAPATVPPPAAAPVAEPATVPPPAVVHAPAPAAAGVPVNPFYQG